MKLVKKITALFFVAVVFFSSVSTEKGFAVSDDFNKDLKNEKFPKYYSSVDLGYITPAESQGESNSCWAFSSLGVLSAYAIKNGLHSYEDADFSEAHLVWYTGNSRSFDESENVYGDGTISESAYDDTVEFFMPTFALAKGSGIAFEKDYPFYSDNSIMGYYGEAERYNHSAGWLSESFMLNTAGDIKKAVVENGAVQVGIYYNPDKLNDTTIHTVENGKPTLKGNCAYYNNNSEGYGHAVIIVGWNDDYSKENFKESCRPRNNGAWLCKNSWGTSWGESGLFWISYENNDLINPMTLSCVSADAYDNVYQYDGFGFNRCITAKQFKTSTVANVFNSDQSEVIEAVGFYTYQQALYPESETGVDIQISIYKNITSGYTTPSQGTLAATYNTNVKYSGYHTFRLPNSIPLNKGEVYSVVITMTTSENTPVILLEGNETDILKYHADPGESFISLSGKTSDFFDAGKKYGGNVCIKAYTKNYDGESILGIEIQPKDYIFHVNDTLNLEATVKPFGTTTTLFWQSSDEDVAVVDNDGIVKGVGEGETVINVSIPETDLSASCQLKVLPEFLKIEWIIDNKIIISRYKYDDSVILPETPSKTGYVFKGWSSKVPDTMPAHDLTFTAVFEKLYICPDCGHEILGETEINAHITAESRMKATVKIKNNNGSNTIKYGETLRLTAITANMPADANIYWYVDGVKQGEGEIFNVSFENGTKTVEVKIVDSNGNVLKNASGNEIKDSESVTVKGGFFQKIISFFKNLFRMNRTVVQSIFKGTF